MLYKVDKLYLCRTQICVHRTRLLIDIEGETVI